MRALQKLKDTWLLFLRATKWYHFVKLPGMVALSDACPIGFQKVAGLMLEQGFILYHPHLC